MKSTSPLLTYVLLCPLSKRTSGLVHTYTHAKINIVQKARYTLNTGVQGWGLGDDGSLEVSACTALTPRCATRVHARCLGTPQLLRAQLSTAAPQIRKVKYQGLGLLKVLFSGQAKSQVCSGGSKIT